MAEGNGGAAAGVRAEAESSKPTRPVTLHPMPFEKCLQGIRTALKDPAARFMMEKIEEAGCQMWPRLIGGAHCDSNGVYSSGLGIRICCNHMTCVNDITQSLVHELVHAYDDCVAKNIDWKNCAHHACSEIRANRLSGNCHYKYELFRGFMKIKGHEPECVKRRALKSLESNPYCSKTAAKDGLEAIWDICYNDTRPFDRAP